MADKKIAIPAYRVQIKELTNGRPQVLAEKKFTGGPGSDDAALNAQFEPGQQFSHVFFRQKGNDGAGLITTRFRGKQTQRIDAKPGQENTFQSGNRTFQVVIDPLPKTEWKFGSAVAFQAPRVEVTSDRTGWYVTFEPREKPCVMTCAIDANFNKDEALPSLPFPSSLRVRKARLHIPNGQFMAAPGGVVRLGVRGAGLEARIQLPPLGQALVVEPEAFEVKGASQPEFLNDVYVQQKYNEKINERHANLAYL